MITYLPNSRGMSLNVDIFTTKRPPFSGQSNALLLRSSILFQQLINIKSLLFDSYELCHTNYVHIVARMHFF